MPEKDRVIRYGTIEKSRAEQLVGFIGKGDIGVRLYAKPEDIGWCAEAQKAQREVNHGNSGVARPVPDMHELSDKLEVERKRGRVPFSIQGCPEEISGLLHRAGIVGTELIPPHE